ncbi:MAG: hypothetical protein ACREK7_01200 [Gemmatimonadota bacterium]
MRPRMVLLLGIVAAAASIPRFGERENERLARSDSDYYLDMAEVFSGEQERPDPRYADPVRPASHHYIRPLFPFLAGQVGHGLLGGDHRTAFSLLNVLAAWAIALLLYHLVATRRPDFDQPWVPGLLFLISFPQLNWGYNILTDTMGYATTLAATLAAVHLVDLHGARPSIPLRTRLSWLGLVVVLQVLAFLTRQTAWITVVAVAFVLLSRRTWRTNPVFAFGLLGALVLAKLPHSLYVGWAGLEGLSIPVRPAMMLDPWYIADMLVKSGVAFHIAWIPALIILGRNGFQRVPDVVLGWSVGALLYMGAGYLHNSNDMIGYPLRLTFALFPLVLPLAAAFFETRDRPRLALGAFAIAYAAISLLGVHLDPGRGQIRVFDLLHAF